jgi:hypothetical protein
MPEPVLSWKIFVDTTQFRQMASATIGVIQTFAIHGTHEIASDLSEGIKSRCPVDTGTLRDSVRVRGSEVYTDCEYAEAVEYGHKPFEVHPVRARALHWDDTFAMSAHIPARAGVHFFFNDTENDRVVDRNTDKLEVEINTVGR